MGGLNIGAGIGGGNSKSILEELKFCFKLCLYFVSSSMNSPPNDSMPTSAEIYRALTYIRQLNENPAQMMKFPLTEFENILLLTGPDNLDMARYFEEYRNAQSLLQIKKTQIEMLKDRKYLIPAIEEFFLNYDPRTPENVIIFRKYYERVLDAERTEAANAKKKPSYTTYRGALSWIYTKKRPNGTEARTIVWYAIPAAQDAKSLGIAVINEILEYAKSQLPYLEFIVIISKEDLSSTALEKIQESTSFRTQHFEDDSLKYNLTKHIYVPKHEALTQEEQEAFYTRTRLLPSQIPILKYVGLRSAKTERDRKAVTDPVVKYYGFIPGQIIRITRVNKVVETLVPQYVTYKIVAG